MTTAASLATALGYWLVGAVLFRALTARLLQFDGLSIGAPSISDRDLLLQSILPALAITGTVSTYLSLFHLFRPEVMVACGIAALIWRRRDAHAIVVSVRDLASDCIAAILHGNLVVLGGLIALCALVYLLLVLSYIPSANIDTWVFQLPLAQSLVAHQGFVYPQIGHPFYSNNPLFFNLLFAQALLFVDHFFAANTINVLVYVGFLICLASFSPRARALGWLVVLFLIAAVSFFSLSATEPLIDLPRSCFSVLAFLFAYRYAQRPRMYELVVSGLLAGVAVAGKYTELLTPCLIGLGLLPTVLCNKRRWLHVAGFAGAITVVATYWYAKNWILLHNPVYPFLFAHPGLTDAWMAEYMREMTRAFDPADRIYVTNLLTLQGWRDFAFILYTWFFENRQTAEVAAAFLLVALFTPRVRVGLLAFWSALLFIIWYALMFNSIRWAVPAYLLFLSAAFLSMAYLLDRALDALEQRDLLPRIDGWGSLVQQVGALARRSQAALAVTLLAGAVIALVVTGGVYRLVRQGVERLVPQWISRDLLPVAMGRSSIDDYLSARREGYMLYRHIAQYNLRTVLQPFDNGAGPYAAAYNGGRDGGWLLQYTTLPSDMSHLAAFLAENDIHYFIYRPGVKDIEIDRFGQAHVDMAKAVLAALLPRSRPLMTDPFGWTLYEIVDPPAQTR